MSSDQLATLNKIKQQITRKFGLDMWKLICFDEMLETNTLFNSLTSLYELKLHVLASFGESTWRFLLTDEFGTPLDSDGEFDVSQDHPSSPLLR